MIIDATTPYPWPYDGAFDPRRTALVICGATGEWARRTPRDATAEAAIARLRAVAADHGMAVVLLDHRRLRSGGPDLVHAADPAPDLIAEPGEITVVAAGVDGFYGSPLDAVLTAAERTDLIVCGRALETTVHSTIRRANDRGYECLTVADACPAIDPTLRPASISSIEMSGGIFGAVGSTDAIVAALTRLSHGGAP